MHLLSNASHSILEFRSFASALLRLGQHRPGLGQGGNMRYTSAMHVIYRRYGPSLWQNMIHVFMRAGKTQNNLNANIFF
jgi:hypothetical protein